MPSRQELAAPSLAPTPAPAPAPSNKKKPKKITGPPPRSKPFKRPYHVSKDRPMFWYRGDANRLFFGSPFSKAFPLLLLDKLPKLQPRPISDDDEPIAVNGSDATKKHFYAARPDGNEPWRSWRKRDDGWSTMEERSNARRGAGVS
ncbi:hypothetical protein B0T13DRAFT_476491 [Neurospora crassa]|nr:hypothetical protein B0T13DRAFT_476491 [Neurospora crassa]